MRGTGGTLFMGGGFTGRGAGPLSPSVEPPLLVAINLPLVAN